MTPDRRRTLVVTRVPEHAIEDRDPSAVISYVLDGSHLACPQGQLVAITTSILARPWGRLDRSQAAQLRLSRDQDVVAERLAAFGPHLRALREQAGLSMGDLARALGCPGARLSQLELAQPDPVREGAGVREDEILPARLPDDARVVPVTPNVRPDLFPDPLKDVRRPREMKAGEIGLFETGIHDGGAVPVNEVDHARREPGLLEELHREMGSEGLRLRGLPDDDIAQERADTRQISGDRRKVERRDRVDEALQRTVVRAVPHARGADRLLGQDLPGELDVEPPEVDQLARAVDLGLVGGLRLPEHGRGVERLPPGAGEEFRGSLKDADPRRKRHRGPPGGGGTGSGGSGNGAGGRFLGCGRGADSGVPAIRHRRK